MRVVSLRAWAVVWLALVLSMSAGGQQPPAAQDVIARLQTKSELTDEDRAQLRQWLTQQVQAIATGEVSQAAKAGQVLRKRLTVGTDAFKNALAELTIEAVQGAYRQARRDQAAQLLALVSGLERVSAQPLFVEALRDQRVPVRSAAAIGLRRLRPKLAAAGGETFSSSLTALREAGKREESPVTLQLIYRALDYTAADLTNPDPKLTAAAVLELLEARAAQYAGGQPKAAGADGPGLLLADRLSGQLGEEERARLALAAAKMLRYGVERYTGDLYRVDDKLSGPVRIAERNRMELFIIAAEKLLTKLTAPPAAPAVAREMQEREAEEKVTYMKIEWNKWADFLQQRYQVDLHSAATAPPPAGESGPARPSGP